MAVTANQDGSHSCCEHSGGKKRKPKCKTMKNEWLCLVEGRTRRRESSERSAVLGQFFCVTFHCVPAGARCLAACFTRAGLCGGVGVLSDVRSTRVVSPDRVFLCGSTVAGGEHQRDHTFKSPCSWQSSSWCLRQTQHSRGAPLYRVGSRNGFCIILANCARTIFSAGDAHRLVIPLWHTTALQPCLRFCVCDELC